MTINLAERSLTPQIQIGQAETRKTAESSLKELLPHNGRKKADQYHRDGVIRHYGFTDISTIMSGITEAGVPSSLLEKLQLDKLKWTFIGGASVLTTLLAGYSDKKNFSGVNSALATLEIARMKPAAKEEPVPFLLRIAGVAEDKIIAVTYDLTKNGRLAELNVSISNQEQNFLDTSADGLILWQTTATTPIPSDQTAPYDTAGLITQEMCNKVRLENPKQPQRRKALCVLAANNGLYFARRNIKPGLINPTASIASIGYYAKKGGEFVIVGLTKEAARINGLAPWEISLPFSLQKL